jgi:two-component system response regulator
MNNGKANGVAKESLRVLHVEDSDDCAALVRRALKLAGFGRALIRVCDGERAIDHLASADENARPHVILLDVNMPGKNGFDVLEWVRHHPQYESIPVVMLTSSQEAADVERAEKLRATKYLQKEGTYRRVVEILEELCLG